VLVETEKMKADVRFEVRQLNKLRKELKEQYAKPTPAQPASNPDGM
jgi:transposase